MSVVTGEYEPPPARARGVPGHAGATCADAGAVTVAAVKTGRLLLALPAVAVLLAGCSSGGGDAASAAKSAAASTPTAASGAAGSSSEPAAAAAQASEEAAADPAKATDPGTAALSAALRASDLPAGWTVQANPVPDSNDLSKNPTLAGICGAAFPSEAHRRMKFPVTGIDPKGAASVVAEAVAYDSPASAAQALAELRAAFASCPAEDRTVVAAPQVTGLAPDSVVVAYQLAGGLRQDVVAQARGAVVSVLIGEDEGTVAGATRSVASRLAALPSGAVGL